MSALPSNMQLLGYEARTSITLSCQQLYTLHDQPRTSCVVVLFQSYMHHVLKSLQDAASTGSNDTYTHHFLHTCCYASTSTLINAHLHGLSFFYLRQHGFLYHSCHRHFPYHSFDVIYCPANHSALGLRQEDTTSEVVKEEARSDQIMRYSNSQSDHHFSFLQGGSAPLFDLCFPKPWSSIIHSSSATSFNPDNFIFYRSLFHGQYALHEQILRKKGDADHRRALLF